MKKEVDVEHSVLSRNREKDKGIEKGEERMMRKI